MCVARVFDAACAAPTLEVMGWDMVASYRDRVQTLFLATRPSLLDGCLTDGQQAAGEHAEIEDG